MILDEKPIDQLQISDIQRLIDNEVCESPRLDYKRDWWGDTDSPRKEMLKDISAFANANGGYIVLGVETKKSEGAGDLECPHEIRGIPRGDYSEKILRSCRDSFDPICVGIDAVQLEFETGKVILIVRVPQSLNAPHMVTFQGLNQFWQRHGTGKQRMSTQEIREVFLGRLNYEERLLQRVARRQDWITAKFVKQPLLHLWATPVVPPESEIDIKDTKLRTILGTSTQNDPYRHNCALYSGQPHPTLRGLRAEQRKRDGRLDQYLEVHRDGFLEFVTSSSTLPVSNHRPPEPQDIPSVVSLRFALYFENFATLVGEVHTHLQTQGPIAIGCTLLNVDGYYLWEGEVFWSQFSEAQWTEPRLDLEHAVVYALANERDGVLRRFNDRLWNAFSLDECPYYSTGKLVVPKG